MKRFSILIVSLALVLLAGCSSGAGDLANGTSSEGGVIRADNSTTERQARGTGHAANARQTAPLRETTVAVIAADGNDRPTTVGRITNGLSAISLAAAASGFSP